MGKPLTDKALTRFLLTVPDEMGAWLYARSKTLAVPRNELICQAVATMMRAVDVPAAPATKPRERFLAAIREHYGLETALAASGVTRAQFDRWQKSPGFALDLQSAQEAYLEALVADLAAIGRGQRKGVAGALVNILSAFHPSFGRAKAELVNKILAFEHGELLRAIREELGETCADGLERACERYEIGQAVRLAWLTE